MNRRLKSFFVTRSLSGVGDEMWLMALPIWLAAHGYSPIQMGVVSSASAVGNILGFTIVPKLSGRFKSSQIAAGADVFQVALFTWLAAMLLLDSIPAGIEFWLFLGFALNLTTAVWFAATETFLSLASSESSEAQSLHRYNYLATNAGPIVGPGLGGIVYQIGGLVSVAVANAVSFFGQMLSLLSLSKEEVTPDYGAKSYSPGFWSGVREIFASKTYVSLTALPSVVKLTLLGALPFVPFVLTEAKMTPLSVGLIGTCYMVGSTAGAYFYKPIVGRTLSRAFAVDSVQTLLAGGALIAGLVVASPVILGLCTLWGGFACARYTIEIRSLRQLLIAPAKISSVVSAQGLLVRLATPLSGFLFGIMLKERGSLVGVPLAVVVCLLFGGIWAAVFVSRSYDKTLAGDGHEATKHSHGNLR